jgi:hypothetical protein
MNNGAGSCVFCKRGSRRAHKTRMNWHYTPQCITGQERVKDLVFSRYLRILYFFLYQITLHSAIYIYPRQDDIAGVTYGSEVRVLNPCTRKRIFSSPTVICKAGEGGILARQQRDAKRSAESWVELKNGWSRAFVLPYMPSRRGQDPICFFKIAIISCFVA